MQKREPTMPRLNLKVVGNHESRCNDSEPTMPRLNLKVVGNHESRCNDSDPRICVRTTMLILALLKVSYVFKLQDKHNASYFSKMS